MLYQGKLGWFACLDHAVTRLTRTYLLLFLSGHWATSFLRIVQSFAILLASLPLISISDRFSWNVLRQVSLVDPVSLFPSSSVHSITTCLIRFLGTYRTCPAGLHCQDLKMLRRLSISALMFSLVMCSMRYLIKGIAGGIYFVLWISSQKLAMINQTEQKRICVYIIIMCSYWNCLGMPYLLYVPLIVRWL